MRSRRPALFRRLSQLPPPILGAVYVTVVLAALTLRLLVPATWPIELLVEVLALVTLFIVVTWYRDEDWLLTGFLLAVSTGVALAASLLWTDVVSTRAFGGLILSAVSASAGLFVRAVIMTPVMGGVVWVARRLGQRAARRRGAGAT